VSSGGVRELPNLPREEKEGTLHKGDPEAGELEAHSKERGIEGEFFPRVEGLSKGMIAGVSCTGKGGILDWGKEGCPSWPRGKKGVEL